jgi:vacuolar-type H+-ATPase subunit F/Vma7
MKIVTICSEWNGDIFLMAGIKDTLVVKSPLEAKQAISNQLRAKDVGIIFIDEVFIPYVKDIIKERSKNHFPLIITIPTIKAERKIDVIKEIIKSTIGFEISLVV